MEHSKKQPFEEPSCCYPSLFYSIEYPESKKNQRIEAFTYYFNGTTWWKKT